MSEKAQKVKKFTRGIIIALFLAVPVLSSFISTVHLVEFFMLGNFSWMSVILACVYEIGSIASFIVPFVLTRVNKGMVWTIFLILAFMQILGNMYFSFDYINIQLAGNANWLSSFQEMLSSLIGGSLALPSMKLAVSAMIGIPIPLISLFFLKSLVDYVNPLIKENTEESSINTNEDVLNKTVIENTKIEEKPLDIKLSEEIEVVEKKEEPKEIYTIDLSPGDIFVSKSKQKDGKIKEKNIEPKVEIDEITQKFEESQKEIEEKIKESDIESNPIGQPNVAVYNNNNIR